MLHPLEGKCGQKVISNLKSSRLQMDSHGICPVVQEKQRIFSWCVDLPRGYKVEHIVFPIYYLVLVN
jgi:hypothetical protein